MAYKYSTGKTFTTVAALSSEIITQMVAMGWAAIQGHPGLYLSHQEIIPSL